MKKRLLSLAMALLIVFALCGCGASSVSGGAADQTSPAGESGYSDKATEERYGTDDTTVSTQTKKDSAKLVYTASMNLETTSFDGAVKGLSTLVDGCGGYFQSSSVNDSGSGYRTGSYTVRVPAEQFAAFCRQVGELCHVTWQTTSAEDVSEAYYDAAGRLKTQQTKLERLQALLAKAEKMEDIITIENAISETEQQIDSLSGELQHYDALVDYSTVNLTLDEVYRLSNVEEPTTGFSSRVSAALVSGWQNFISAAQSIVLVLAYGWVWFVILAAVAAVAAVTVRKKRNSRLRPDGEKAGQIMEKENDKPDSRHESS